MNEIQEQVIARLNSKNIEPVPDYLLDLQHADKVYIFNVYKREHRVDLVPGIGAVIIPACPEGRQYSDPVIIPGLVFEYYDAGDGRYPFRQSPARTKTARNGRTTPGVIGDVLKDYAPKGMYSPNLVQWGCFAAAGSTPTQAEISQANRELRQTAEMFMNDAQSKFMQGPNMRSEINAVHRELAGLLNLRPVWMEEETQERGVCPACGGNIALGVAKCFHCSAILDHDKWAQFVEAGDVIPVKRGPGRPRKEESL